MPDDDQTWTDEQDAQYARRIGELLIEGHEEFEIEEIAAAEVNAGRGSETTKPPAAARRRPAAQRPTRRRRPSG